MRPQPFIICTLVTCTLAFSGCSSVTANSDKSSPKSTAKADTSETLAKTDDSATPKEPERATEPSSPIEIVKNGTLAGYDSTTVGKAFDGTFQEPKWSTFETAKGAILVEFNGTISTEAMRSGNFMAHNGDGSQTYPVKFQFALSADKTRFQLTFVERHPFHYRPANGYVYGNGITREEPAPDRMILDFIYR